MRPRKERGEEANVEDDVPPLGADARSPEEIDPAFAAMAGAGVDAFFFLSEVKFIRPLPVLQRILRRPMLSGSDRQRPAMLAL